MFTCNLRFDYPSYLIGCNFNSGISKIHTIVLICLALGFVTSSKGIMKRRFSKCSVSNQDGIAWRWQDEMKSPDGALTYCVSSHVLTRPCKLNHWENIVFAGHLLCCTYFQQLWNKKANEALSCPYSSCLLLSYNITTFKLYSNLNCIVAKLYSYNNISGNAEK